MNPLIFLLYYLCFGIFHVEAQSSLTTSAHDAATNFQPSLAVVIGILCIMFVLTFVLLVYAKFCHRRPMVETDPQNQPEEEGTRSHLSGIDKTVIESLPFFRFSSLKGSKHGLECAVCLSKFEDIEILRLLPRCKHAFHVKCVDQWLERHSSCPLCRHKVSAEDLTYFAYSNSMRFFRDLSELREDSNIELFVQREEEPHGSSRFSIGSSFREIEKINKEEEEQEEEVLIHEEDGDSDEDKKVLHKFNHKIVVSDVVLKNRWSSVSSSDFMFLNSEMLSAISSNRFSALDSNPAKAIENEQILKIKDEMERSRLFESKVNSDSFSGLPSTSDSKANSCQTSRFMNPAERRSMSEITSFSRFRDLSARSRLRENSLVGNSIEEERIRRLWLPIARRTVQWFASRERAQQPQNPRQTLDV